MSRAPRVIAHRGASGRQPENTLPAFALALELGADMIETDLHLTRDGAIVLVHDSDLGHLGMRGEVGHSILPELRALDAGGGQRVPTLAEALDAHGARCDWNLELKWGADGDYPGLEAAVQAEVAARGLERRVLYSSFHDAVLARVRERVPEARLGVLVSARRPGRPLERARRLGAEAIHPWVGLATGELVGAAHAEGLAVHVYTVDDPEEMARLLDLGVDGIFTNHPDRMRALLAG